MSESKYEENISNRLRNRLDGTFLDKSAADVIDQLLDRVDELEAQADQVSEEFEKDCWRALRQLLKDTGFDWKESDGEVTAEQAYEHISEAIRASLRERAIEAEDAEAERIDNSQFGVGA